MMEFLQEYGKIIVAVLVVLALVAIVILFRDPITAMFSGLFQNFFADMGRESGLQLPEFKTGK